MNKQEKYRDFYSKVNDFIKKESLSNPNFKKETELINLCSISLDNNDKNQINVELLLGSSLNVLKIAKIELNKRAKEFGFTVNYVNMSGDF